MTDAGFMARGLCLSFPDINFVPDPFLGQSSLPAKNVCVHCPAMAECRAYRDVHPDLGVWGGEDEADLIVRQGLPVDSGCSCDTAARVINTLLGAVCTGCGQVTQ